MSREVAAPVKPTHSSQQRLPLSSRWSGTYCIWGKFSFHSQEEKSPAVSAGFFIYFILRLEKAFRGVGTHKTPNWLAIEPEDMAAIYHHWNLLQIEKPQGDSAHQISSKHMYIYVKDHPHSIILSLYTGKKSIFIYLSGCWNPNVMVVGHVKPWTSLRPSSFICHGCIGFKQVRGKE